MEVSSKIKEEPGKNMIEKVDWLYEKRGHDSEEYLTGKRFEELKEDTTEDPVPGFDDAIAKRSELDMKIKMREDPLYAIKLKEEEAKRRILDNPLNFKKLNSLKEKRKHKSEKEKKSHKDKSHKKEKDRKNKNDSDEETNDLLKKYMSLKKINQGKDAKAVMDHQASKSGDHSGSSDSEDHKKQYGLNIKRKYAMSYEHNKVDYSKLNFKTSKASSKRERTKLTEEEKEEKRREMMMNAEKRHEDKRSKQK